MVSISNVIDIDDNVSKQYQSNLILFRNLSLQNNVIKEVIKIVLLYNTTN